jgi:predicted aspartyl protease
VEVFMRVFLLVPVFVFALAAAGTAADRGPASVPLTIDAHGGVGVDVRVNGAGPFRFLLDTGAARTVIADDLAREVGAAAVARSEMVTSAGSDMRLVVRLASITMTPAARDGVLAVVLPAGALTPLGRGVRGLLGQDFLSGFNYTLDYRRARLTWDEAVSCDAAGASRLVASEGRFIATFDSDERGALRLVPDSGADVPVLFLAPGSRPAQPDVRLAGVLRGGTGAARVTLRTLRVGAVTLRDVDAYEVERVDPAADGLLPLHRFASVSFAAGGGCLIARR